MAFGNASYRLFDWLIKGHFIKKGDTLKCPLCRARPAGFEPAPAAPEAAALSIRLRAQIILNFINQFSAADSVFYSAF